jgi:hypothetical protein
MNRILACVLFGSVWLFPAGAMGAERPDFNNPDAVFQDLRGKVDACTKAGDNCSVACGYALRTLKNFFKSNPGGDPSIFRQRWQPCYEGFRDAGLESATVATTAEQPGKAAGGSGENPDFSDHASVVAALKTLQSQCGEDAACQKNCGYALKAMKNFNHPEAHYAGLRKNKWESCRKSVPGGQMVATASTAPSFDTSKFIVAGVPLGGDMNSVRDRLFLLRAYGYFPAKKQEYAATLVSHNNHSDPAPDIIKNYEGTIKEETVYIYFEATGDGKVHKINFEQKEPMNIDQVTEALLERYGKPSKHQGNYLIWGCDKGPEEGFCVKANPSATSLTIWASDENTREKGYAEYQQQVLKAKGVKSGAKF